MKNAPPGYKPSGALAVHGHLFPSGPLAGADRAPENQHSTNVINCQARPCKIPPRGCQGRTNGAPGLSLDISGTMPTGRAYNLRSGLVYFFWFDNRSGKPARAPPLPQGVPPERAAKSGTPAGARRPPHRAPGFSSPRGRKREKMGVLYDSQQRRQRTAPIRRGMPRGAAPPHGRRGARANAHQERGCFPAAASAPALRAGANQKKAARPPPTPPRGAS
jgi:hypothetical protein